MLTLDSPRLSACDAILLFAPEVSLFHCVQVHCSIISFVSMRIMPRGKCIFNPELAKKYPFIKKSNKKSSTDSDVRCDLCNSEFNLANAGKTDIEKHLQTIKHKKALQAASSSRTVTQFFPSSTDRGLAACEGVWAYHVIQSNHSFLSSDCASKLFRTVFEINKFHCGQTKCRAIAINVFAPYSRNVLKNDLAKSHYITVSTDASNHGNIKMMPVVVRYFVPTVGVKVKMLDFSSEKGETSEIITSMIMRAAEKNQITNKIVGFCGDNCPTNFGNSVRGGRNNVYYRLKQSNPSLIGVGCSAHIVHNAMKHACLLLPVNIEYIVVTIYSHFYINTVRVEALKSLCESIGTEYTKLLGYAKTRFLALGPAIGSILKLFEPLREYFLELRRCPPNLREFFTAPFSRLWLLFVKEQVIHCDDSSMMNNMY